MESPEEIAIDFVKVNLGSYLTGAPGCDFEWIKLIIGISGIAPGDLANVFLDLDGFGDKKRYRKIFKLCRNENFHCELII
jgi:hypothetical protein